VPRVCAEHQTDEGDMGWKDTARAEKDKARPNKKIRSALNILSGFAIAVPDRPPALFEYGHPKLGEMAHRWAPEIELLTPDRVIWAYDFDAEWALYAHATFSSDKRWKKGLNKMTKRYR